MANCESSFKRELRDSIGMQYGKKAHAWPVNDKFRAGTADDFVSYNGSLFGIESKFVSRIPARPSSNLLQHPLEDTQRRFLDGLNRTNNYGVVLVGFSDMMIICETKHFNEKGQTNLNALRALTTLEPWRKVMRVSTGPQKWTLDLNRIRTEMLMVRVNEAKARGDIP